MAVKVLCLSYWKACDNKSSVSFFSPDMDNVSRGETCAHRCRSASVRRRRPSDMECFDVRMFAHANVGMLSQNILM